MYICPKITARALHFRGKKVLSFLQGMCSSDVRTLKPEHALSTTFCQHQGKVIAMGTLIMPNDDHVVFVCEPCTIPALSRYLQPFLELSKIIASEEPTHCFGLIYPQERPDFVSHRVLNTNNHTTIDIHPKLSIGVLRQPDLDLPGHTISVSFWYAHLIKAHIPILTQATQSMFTPNMLSLVPSVWVSLQKGCYCGQEIIARTHHLGKSKRQLLTYQSRVRPTDLAPGHDCTLLTQSDHDSPVRTTLLFCAQQQTDNFYLQVCGTEPRMTPVILNDQEHPLIRV